MADAVDLFLDGEFIEARQWQAQEQTYPAVENHEGFSKGPFDLLWRTCYRRRIGHAPVGRHRLAGPHGANFPSRVIANGEDKIEGRSARPCELTPIFAAEALGREVS